MKSDKVAKRKRILVVIISLLVITLLIVSLLALKICFGKGVMCTLYETTGLYCPGCGGTRMAIAILELKFHQAFRYNPYIFTTLPMVAIITIKQIILYIKNNEMLEKLDIYLIIYAIGLIIFGVIRNIPFLSFLAPTVI